MSRIADAQQVPVRVACERAVSDALFASAVLGDPSRAALVAVSARSAHARALLEQLHAAVRGEGPAKDEEIELLTRERWVDLDRPEAVRAVHFVARVKSPQDDERARQFAEKLGRELADVKEPREFLRRAQAAAALAKAGGIELGVERLPPVSPDGRAFDPDAPLQQQQQGQFDPIFTAAAHGLAQPGDKTELLKTPFGYHVILLEERLPEQRLPLAERRELLQNDVFARRAEGRVRSIIDELKSKTALDVSRAADELTAKVPVAP